MVSLELHFSLRLLATLSVFPMFPFLNYTILKNVFHVYQEVKPQSCPHSYGIIPGSPLAFCQVHI